MRPETEQTCATEGRVIVHEGDQSLSLHTLEFGDPARPTDVVWLHANGLNARTYCHTLAPLSDSLRILAVDQRGHGGTPQKRDISDKRDAYDLRDDLLALLDIVAKDRPVVLAGHSLGACVSLLAAAEAPNRVKGLALFDPVIMPREATLALIRAGGLITPETEIARKARTRRNDFPSKQAAFESYRGRAIFSTWPDAAVADYVDAGFRDAAGGGVELTCAPEWESANFTAHGHDAWDAMSRVQAPVKIYRAEHGSTCSIAASADFPRPTGQAEVISVAGATHFLPIERPDIVQTALMAVASASVP